jgi:hypothetical protein
VDITDEETYSKRFLVRTYLDLLLKEGDNCLGYDLQSEVFPESIEDSLKSFDFT